MIKTSYFANHRQFPPALKKISVSRFSPTWAELDSIAFELAPSKKLLQDYKAGKVSEKDYKTQYYEETLSKLNPEIIYKKYKGSIFLCYEISDHFCHRKLIAEWLMNAGYHIEEVKTGSKVLIFQTENFNDEKYLINLLSRFLKNYHKPIIYYQNKHINSKIIEDFAKNNGYETQHYKSFFQGSLVCDVGLVFFNEESDKPKLRNHKENKSKYFYNCNFKTKQINMRKGY